MVLNVDSGTQNASVNSFSIHGQQVRQESWCVTVVVVSDDLAFLNAFAQSSLHDHLLVWSTRLLVVTRLRLHQLQLLHRLLFITNSMLLITEESLHGFRCGVYLQLPYTPWGAQTLKVASWTPHQGLVLTSHLTLFPHKFSRFPERPTLKLAAETTPLMTMVTQVETQARQGRMVEFSGPMAYLVSYLAKALNFSYMYLRPPDGSWGLKREDGTWSGMLGMVIRQDVSYLWKMKEVDVAVGPFGVSGVRAEVVDFTRPVLIDYSRILGARGQPEVNPWGFLFPLEPLVWAAIVAALLVLPTATILMSSCFSLSTHHQTYTFPATSAYLRLLLNQNVLECGGGWWWERVMLAVWGLVALVLTQSYAGNLMALLAVSTYGEIQPGSTAFLTSRYNRSLNLISSNFKPFQGCLVYCHLSYFRDFSFHSEDLLK
nr:glutamate receptor U1-like [Procambarus clarkii]